MLNWNFLTHNIAYNALEWWGLLTQYAVSIDKDTFDISMTEEY